MSSLPSSLCPVSRRAPPSDRSDEGGATACDLVDPSRVYLPGGQEIRHILGNGAALSLSLSLLARSPVVKSRDFFLRAVYGNVEGRRGRTRSCVNSVVLHDGWESCACGGFCGTFPSARNLSLRLALTSPSERGENVCPADPIHDYEGGRKAAVVHFARAL